MDARGQYTREEIFSQPEAWAAAIEILKNRVGEIQDFSQRVKHPQLIFTGCGSTYYLSCAAAALFQELTGMTAHGIPASELWLSSQGVYSLYNSTVLVAFSRSGETSETLQACEKFKAMRIGEIITLVCDPASNLANLGAMNLIFPSGMERSIAQTRAFSTLYLGAMGLSAIWAGRMDLFEKLSALPSIGRKILDQYGPLAARYGKNLKFDRIYFLGSGGRYGLACELNLKMKEMSLTHSEAFHFLEFRHGPKAMVNSNTLVLGLLSETNLRHEQAVLKDVGDLGAEIISMGERDADVLFNSGLEEVIRNIFFLPFGQVLAYERSIAKGLDPDCPKHLDPVVILSK